MSLPSLQFRPTHMPHSGSVQPPATKLACTQPDTVQFSGDHHQHSHDCGCGEHHHHDHSDGKTVLTRIADWLKRFIGSFISDIWARITGKAH